MKTIPEIHFPPAEKQNLTRKSSDWNDDARPHLFDKHLKPVFSNLQLEKTKGKKIRFLRFWKSSTKKGENKSMPII